MPTVAAPGENTLHGPLEVLPVAVLTRHSKANCRASTSTADGSPTLTHTLVMRLGAPLSLRLHGLRDGCRNTKFMHSGGIVLTPWLLSHR